MQNRCKTLLRDHSVPEVTLKACPKHYSVSAIPETLTVQGPKRPPTPTWTCNGVSPRPGMGYPPRPGTGYPPLPRPEMGYPLPRPEMGYPPTQTWDGVPPYLDMRWGTPPTQTWDGVPPLQVWTDWKNYLPLSFGWRAVIISQIENVVFLTS